MTDDATGAPAEATTATTTPAPTATAAPDASAAAAPLTPSGPAEPLPSTPPEPAPSAGGAWMDKLPLWFVPAVLVGVVALGVLVAELVPSFFDQVVWKYYWGPIKADAENVERLTLNGVDAHSGYNVVNTLSWAVLLGLCILGIAQMLRHYRTPMDARLIVAATAWVVIGSVAHVLEDTGLLLTPLQYLFITPPIYLLFGAFGIGAFLIGQWLRRIEAKRGLQTALRMLWVVHVVLVLVWLALWLKPWDQITVYVNPLWVALIAVVSFFVARHFILKTGTVDPTQLCLTLSLGAALLVGAYVYSFLLDPWMEPSDEAMPWSSVLAPLGALLVTAIVAFTPRKGLLGFMTVALFLAVTGFAATVFGKGLFADVFEGRSAIRWAVAAAAGAYAAWAFLRSWATGPNRDRVARDLDAALRMPINLLIVFSQLVDAIATSFGIDLAGYEEKHVLSAGIIDEFRAFSADVGFDLGMQYPTFIAFVLVKLLVSLLVIYAIDVASKDDPKSNPTMIGLVKFAIIMVGLGPGVRDFVRLSLGV